MDAMFSNPLSEAFTKKQSGATFADARPKSLLKKLYMAVDPCILRPPMPCGGWSW